MLMHYMDPKGICTILDVNYKTRTIKIENKTDLLLHRAFGVNEYPTWDDYEAFLRDRCFPETRAHLKWVLADLGLDFYDPLEIIRKTQGRVAEDCQWIEFIKE